MFGDTLKITGYYDAEKVTIKNTGKNNEVNFGDKFRTNALSLTIIGNNNKIHFSDNCRINASVRIAGDCTLHIGENFFCSNRVSFLLAEGTEIVIGNDCLFSSGITIRTDDSHGIFDVNTKKRLNHSKSIYIGNHVWLSAKVTILKNSTIKDGSVIGLSSIVSNKTIPNNVVAVGNPCKVIKKNITWEKPKVYERKYFKNGEFTGTFDEKYITSTIEE